MLIDVLLYGFLLANVPLSHFNAHSWTKGNFHVYTEEGQVLLEVTHLHSQFGPLSIPFWDPELCVPPFPLWADTGYFKLQGSFGSRIVLYVTFYLINFSDISLSVVYSDQLFDAARYILNILAR